MCQTPSDRPLSARGVHPTGEGVGRGPDASQKFKGDDKHPESTKKDTKFGQLIIRKIIKIIATMSHFEAKIHKIRFLVSVRLCLRWSLTHTVLD